MTQPSAVSPEPGRFDRFASAVARWTSKAWFFAFCQALVLLWAPSWFLLYDLDVWQLIINTITTIITFLLVALLQNTEKRADDAVQKKLNAIAAYLASRAEEFDGDADAATELRAAVGLEDREST